MKTEKKRKLKRVVRKLEKLRRHHRKLAYAKPNIRISSNKDRAMAMAANLGYALAFDQAIRLLKDVK